MRKVVVTGGSRGIGLAIGEALVAAGFEVVAVARSEGPALQEARARLGSALHFLAWDLAQTGGLAALAAAVRRTGGPLYGLVNNAGIGTAGVLSTMPDANIAGLLQLNLLAPITLTKYLVRPMMAARAGRVVNIASIVGQTGYSGLSAYAATKAGLVGFTRSLARELGPLGITVNAVAPGFIATEMTHGLSPEQAAKIAHRSALGRLAAASDVAAAVAFLMGDQAGAITGTVLTVDAGNTA